MNNMSTPGSAAQPPEGLTRESAEGMTIGELAARVDMPVSTLRMWERRYGFPQPARLASGHRRYPEEAVELVVEAKRLRAAGLRLEQAVADVVESAAARPDPTSVFATLRRAHPESPVRTLRKRTLLGLSWAIEDEFGARADRAHLFGAFESHQNYEAARPRWESLARVAASTHVFADFPDPDPAPKPDEHGHRPQLVTLEDRHPMRREWAVVCDRGELPIALSAWELPGQSGVPDADRRFETVWSVHPAAVRTAARACARAALESGSPAAAAVMQALKGPPASTLLDPDSVSSLITRMVAYVDEANATGRPPG